MGKKSSITSQVIRAIKDYEEKYGAQARNRLELHVGFFVWEDLQRGKSYYYAHLEPTPDDRIGSFLGLAVYMQDDQPYRFFLKERENDVG